MLLGACCAAVAQTNSSAAAPIDEAVTIAADSTQGSEYVPMDSWIYPALDRLHALGYLDSAFLGLRPWTRLSMVHMLDETASRIESNPQDEEARDIDLALVHELQPDIDEGSGERRVFWHLDSVYAQVRGIGGTPLRDSYHLGQTMVDDYGRPYESGFNTYDGFAARVEAGRFSFYYRGELQHAPGAAGYSPALATFLSQNLDGIPIDTNPHQDTIPAGPIASTNDARVMEATLSYHLLGHEISLGKSDHWLGPDRGASMLWSNNAEDIYGFQIDRVEPLRIPLISSLLGPLRYEFFVGSLKGHSDPNDPWVHMEKISFKPTRNVEIGFDRMVIWGGKGHEPITLHTFLRSFFSFQNVTPAEKDSPRDPGARFSTFDFNYRLPFLRNWVTLYTDSLVHDDVSPPDAPRRAAIHPGIYLSRIPGAPRFDFRAEAGNTDPSAIGRRAGTGQFYYYESIQKQGPTNKGFLMGDWVGRQGKGYQSWLTYHISPDEDIQFSYRNAKAATQFIPGGTTQNDFAGEVRKRIGKEIEVQGWVQYEGWKAPLYKTGGQSDTTAAAQITWYPREKSQH
ncbi:MAG TPA: capsule assembly Wzi family protein [Acidobacteriaceae bacterium]